MKFCITSWLLTIQFCIQWCYLFALLSLSLSSPSILHVSVFIFCLNLSWTVGMTVCLLAEKTIIGFILHSTFFSKQGVKDHSIDGNNKWYLIYGKWVSLYYQKKRVQMARRHSPEKLYKPTRLPTSYYVMIYQATCLIVFKRLVIGEFKLLLHQQKKPFWGHKQDLPL